MKGIFEDAQRQWAVEILKSSQRSCTLWNPKSSRVRSYLLVAAGEMKEKQERPLGDWN